MTEAKIKEFNKEVKKDLEQLEIDIEMVLNIFYNKYRVYPEIWIEDTTTIEDSGESSSSIDVTAKYTIEA